MKRMYVCISLAGLLIGLTGCPAATPSGGSGGGGGTGDSGASGRADGLASACPGSTADELAQVVSDFETERDQGATRAAYMETAEEVCQDPVFLDEAKVSSEECLTCSDAIADLVWGEDSADPSTDDVAVSCPFIPSDQLVDEINRAEAQRDDGGTREEALEGWEHECQNPAKLEAFNITQAECLTCANAIIDRVW